MTIESDLRCSISSDSVPQLANDWLILADFELDYRRD